MSSIGQEDKEQYKDSEKVTELKINKNDLGEKWHQNLTAKMQRARYFHFVLYLLPLNFWLGFYRHHIVAYKWNKMKRAVNYDKYFKKANINANEEIHEKYKSKNVRANKISYWKLCSLTDFGAVKSFGFISFK